MWRVAGAEPRLGAVVAKTKSNVRTVRWEDDESEGKVKANDPIVRFAFRGTHKLEWLLDPDSFDRDFRSNPGEIFVSVLRDERTPMTASALQKEIVHVSGDPAEVKRAWAAVKPTFSQHKHVLTVGTTLQWSDEPVDPYAAIRRLTPEEALQRLLKGAVKADVKNILAEVIRSGFRS